MENKIKIQLNTYIFSYILYKKIRSTTDR